MTPVTSIFHPNAAPSRPAWASRQFWRKLLVVFFARYRPERHYMRGPGPKWREKHRGQAARRPFC